MTDKLEKQLEKAVDAQDEAKTSSLIDRILTTEPTHRYALECKAVLSIHQGKFQVALTVLEQLRSSTTTTSSSNVPSFSSDVLTFQAAYCLYRLQKLDEAMATLQGLTTVQAKHLRAQIAYNLEQYDTTIQIYEEFLANEARDIRDDEEKQEIITNLTAAYSASEGMNENATKRAHEAVRRADVKTADMLFNLATADLEARQYDQALEKLNTAEQIILKQHPKSTLRSFEDFEKQATPVPAVGGGQQAGKTAERALLDEVAAVWVQRAYVYYAQELPSQTEAILSVMLRHKVTSPVLSAVIVINWAAIRRHHDFFDTHRRLKQVQAPQLFQRLTTRQRLLVRYNTGMLLLNTGNLGACRTIAEQLVLEHPESDLGPQLQLAVMARAGGGGGKGRSINSPTKSDNAAAATATTTASLEESLQKILKKAGAASGTETKLQTRLIVAQFRLDRGDIQGAMQELHGVSRVGAALTAASHFLKVSDRAKALAVLTDCLPQVTGSKEKLQFATRGAQLCLQNGAFDEAAKLLEALESTEKSAATQAEVQGLLVASLSRVDPAKARKIATAKLAPPPSDKTISMAEAEDDDLVVALPTRQAVEKAGYVRPASSTTQAQDAAAQKGPKKRPMRRPPKSLAAAAASVAAPTAAQQKAQRLDPERWLPLTLRTYYKDIPERRKREMRRIRADEQEEKRKASAKRKLQGLNSPPAAPAPAPSS